MARALKRLRARERLDVVKMDRFFHLVHISVLCAQAIVAGIGFVLTTDPAVDSL
jgi:hypothetical protein